MKWPAKINWAWLRRTALALVCGYAGGALFNLLGVPLPWTLGSLAMAAVLAVSGVNWALPVFFRNFSRPTIGVMAGSAFTLPVALSMLSWWPVVLMLLASYVVMTLLGWLFFTRICKHDHITAVFSAVPGGLAELTLLGSQLGGNIRVLISVHTIRVVTAVIALPFIVRLLADPGSEVIPMASPGATAPLSLMDWALLIGCAVIGFSIGRRFTRIGGIMVFPLVLSAVVHIAGLSETGPPSWLVVLMQVIIGSIVGSRFAGITGAEFRATAFQALVWAAIMLGFAMAMAMIAVNVVDVSLPALVLAFAPGGFAEMTILAYAIGIEVAFVVSCHVFRAVSVLLVAPTAAQLLPRSRHAPIEHERD